MTVSDETKKTLARNRILEAQLELLCGRIWQLEKERSRLSEPIFIRNKTGSDIIISQIDEEYQNVTSDMILPGAGRLFVVDSRRWEVS